jgi:hypothetical protein
VSCMRDAPWASGTAQRNGAKGPGIAPDKDVVQAAAMR